MFTNMRFSLKCWYCAFTLHILIELFDVSHAQKRHRQLRKAPECDISQYPFMVSLYGGYDIRTVVDQDLPSYHHFAGALITLKWILTGSHYTHYPLKLQAGSNHEIPYKSETGVLRNVSKKFSHYEPSGRPLSALNDNGWLAFKLAATDKELEETSKIKPIRLTPSRGFVDTCKELTVLGWGFSLFAFQDDAYLHAQEEGPPPPLKCRKAVLRRCNPESDTTIFCYAYEDPNELEHDSTKYDTALIVVCGGYLVGITKASKNWNHGERVYAAVNISHFTAWIHKETGVAVAFEAEPDPSYRNPIPSAERNRSTKFKGKTTLWFIVLLLLFNLAM